jgi:hypothetical protein
MMDLKKISKSAIPAALAKAEKYRLLNEPAQAESICRDVLVADAGNQAARLTLLLSLTDQFHAGAGDSVRPAEEALAGVTDPYDQAYYAGIICERWARALLASGDPGAQAFEWLRDAMTRYEKAEALGREGNDDPILRWNACARAINGEKVRAPIEHGALDGGDDAPHR